MISLEEEGVIVLFSCFSKKFYFWNRHNYLSSKPQMNEPEFDKALRLILNVGCQFGFGSIVCRKYILSLFGIC